MYPNLIRNQIFSLFFLFFNQILLSFSLLFLQILQIILFSIIFSFFHQHFWYIITFFFHIYKKLSSLWIIFPIIFLEYFLSFFLSYFLFFFIELFLQFNTSTNILSQLFIYFIYSFINIIWLEHWNFYWAMVQVFLKSICHLPPVFWSCVSNWRLKISFNVPRIMTLFLWFRSETKCIEIFHFLYKYYLGEKLLNMEMEIGIKN